MDAPALAPPAHLFRRRSSLERLVLDPELEIGAGGEAVVRALPDDPALVAKLYHQPSLERARKLALMVARPPAMPEGTAIAWPADVLLQERGGFAGFLMPRADGPRIFEFYNPVSRRQTAPAFHPGKLHRAGRNLAAAFDALHAAGYVVGDVNESNILVDPADASVTLVDADSLQVRDPDAEVTFRSRVGKPEFTPPELQGVSFGDVDRAPEHDRFGLAVLLYLLLMEGTHPFALRLTGSGEALPVEDRIRLGLFPHASATDDCHPPRLAPPFETLHPEVAALFLRAFAAGHADAAARPTAAEWRDALEAAEAALAICPANALHRFSPRLEACPWCERTALLGGRDPFPAGAEALSPSARPRRPVRRMPVAAPFAGPAPAFAAAPQRPVLRSVGQPVPAVWGPSGVYNPLCVLLPSALVAALAQGMMIQPIAAFVAMIALALLIVRKGRDVKPVTVIVALAMSFAALALVGLGSMSSAQPLDSTAGADGYDSPSPGFRSGLRVDAPAPSDPTVPFAAPADVPRAVGGSLDDYALPELISVPVHDAPSTLPPRTDGGTRTVIAAGPGERTVITGTPGKKTIISGGTITTVDEGDPDLPADADAAASDADGAIPDAAANPLRAGYTKPRMTNPRPVASALATHYATWDHADVAADTAVLWLHVGADGVVRPGGSQLISSTHRAAGEAALATVPYMRFEPATDHGRRVPAWVVQRLVIVP